MWTPPYIDWKNQILWCLSFIDFFSVIFALANYNFDNIIKKQTFFVRCSWHGFTNSKLCSLNSNKFFTHSDLVQKLKPYLIRFVDFLNSKLVELCREIFFVLICPSSMSYWNPSHFFEALQNGMWMCIHVWMDYMVEHELEREPKLILVEDCILLILDD